MLASSGSFPLPGLRALPRTFHPPYPLTKPLGTNFFYGGCADAGICSGAGPAPAGFLARPATNYPASVTPRVRKPA